MTQFHQEHQQVFGQQQNAGNDINNSNQGQNMPANLQPIDSQSTEQARSLLQELSIWSPSPKVVKEHNFNVALDAVNQAILETKKYLKLRREGRDRDAATENRLTNLWMDAGDKIRPYDGHLAGLCYVRGNGWADEATWTAPENINLPIRTDQMLERLRNLVENPPPRDVPSWFPIAGVIFLAFAVLSLFYLLVAPQGVSPDRHIIFDVWVAFCFAASASFLGGSAVAHGTIPWPTWLGGKSPPIQFSTAGGIAAFIILLVIMISIFH